AQRTSDLFHTVALDDVADLEIVEVRDVQTAFEALTHLADVILESLQAAQFAFVNLDAIANDPDTTPALKLPIGDHATGHRTDSRNLEDLADFGRSKQNFPLFR